MKLRIDTMEQERELSGLRALSDFAGHPDSVLKSPIRFLTTVCNSNFKRSNTLSWPSWAPGTHGTYIYMQKNPLIT